MVRGIKPGKVPPKIVTCDQCNAVLQYMDADTRYEMIGTVRNGWVKRLYLTCPMCGHDISINEKIPETSDA